MRVPIREVTKLLARPAATAVLVMVATVLSGFSPLAAQSGRSSFQLVFQRLGISESSLAGIPLDRVEIVCAPSGRGSTCDLRYPTRSDEACRALAVRFGLNRRSSQLADGGKPSVVARATCADGIVAVFSAGSRRAVMGHRDAAGNTGQREIPL